MPRGGIMRFGDWDEDLEVRLRVVGKHIFVPVSGGLGCCGLRV